VRQIENIGKSSERQRSIPVRGDSFGWLRGRLLRQSHFVFIGNDISPFPCEAKRVSRFAIRTIGYSVGNQDVVYRVDVCVADVLAFKREILHNGMEYAGIRLRVPASDRSQDVSLRLST